MINYISKALFSFVLLFCISVSLTAQDSRFIGFEAQNDEFHFQTTEGLYILQFYTPEILEVNFLIEGSELGHQPPSHAVVKEPQQTSVVVSEDDSRIEIASSGIRASFDKQRSKFTFYYKSKRLLRESKGFVMNEEDDGYRVDFRITETELLMGGGSRALGMNRRGHNLRLFNRAHYGYNTRSELKNYTLPMVLSSNMYAVHFDNPTIGYLDLDSENDNSLGFEAYSGRKTYQIIAGDSWEQILYSYNSLTGFQPLPPLWALGNFSSRFGYRDQDEVLKTIRLFRELDVPVDAVIIDLYWFGPEMKGHMGNLAFDTDNWPDPAAMVQELEDMGVKTVLITEPFILTTSNRWDEAVEAGVLARDSLGNVATYDFFFGNTGLIDIFKPEAREWFWGIYRDLMNTYGIHGWWGDLGEPEVHPEWVQHSLGSASEVHNIYGHHWARMVHEGFREDFPNTRPFNLMRAGYAGSQRYGMIPWTGDVDRSWGGLKSQPEISLQMGLQGLAYMHSDLGGFAWPNKDEELYTRWMQYGVFQPVYRPHAQDDVPSEPVFWDERTIELTKKAIELRYQLLPYIYTAAYQHSTTGLPFMRPIFFEEPDNFKTYLIDESYLFGDDMLVAPVLRQGEPFVSVYLPAGSNWYCFYTGKEFAGGVHYDIPTVEEYIPVFVRGGAVIPKADLVQTTDDYSVDHLTLTYFHDASVVSHHTKVFNDDGLSTFTLESDAYEKLHINIDNSHDSVSLSMEAKTSDNFTSEFNEISFVAFGFSEAPANILFNGNEISFKFDADTGKLYVDRVQLQNGSGELIIEL